MPTKSVETLSVYVAVHGKLPKKESIQKSLIQLFRINLQRNQVHSYCGWEDTGVLMWIRLCNTHVIWTISQQRVGQAK